jgi:hypothetical protein
MNRLNILLLIFLSTNFSLADPAVFFVANEGQWPGDFAYRYEGGGGAWFITRSGLTIDLKQYDSAFPPARGGGGVVARGLTRFPPPSGD